MPPRGLWQGQRSSPNPQGPHATRAQGFRHGNPHATAVPATMPLQRCTQAPRAVTCTGTGLGTDCAKGARAKKTTDNLLDGGGTKQRMPSSHCTRRSDGTHQNMLWLDVRKGAHAKLPLKNDWQVFATAGSARNPDSPGGS